MPRAKSHTQKGRGRISLAGTSYKTFPEHFSVLIFYPTRNSSVNVDFLKTFGGGHL